jgi:hypothetical protein
MHENRGISTVHVRWSNVWKIQISRSILKNNSPNFQGAILSWTSGSSALHDCTRTSNAGSQAGRVEPRLAERGKGLRMRHKELKLLSNNRKKKRKLTRVNMSKLKLLKLKNIIQTTAGRCQQIKFSHTIKISTKLLTYFMEWVV